MNGHNHCVGEIINKSQYINFETLGRTILDSFRSQSGGLQYILPKLTVRESEIMHLIALGKTAKEIGKILLIAENTANDHLRNIYRKLHVRNRTEAVVALIVHEAFSGSSSYEKAV